MIQAPIPNISIPPETIAAFCQRWNIIELALFGSVLRDDFRPDSDVDVLVTYAPGAKQTFRGLMAMEDELSALFERPVDLIDRQSVLASPNYIRRKEILRTAQVIYEA